MNETRPEPVAENAHAAADATGDRPATSSASLSPTTILPQTLPTTTTAAASAPTMRTAASTISSLQANPASGDLTGVPDSVELAKEQLKTLENPTPKRFIQKITVIDTKKLQQLGIDRRIAEALSKQKFGVKQEAKTKTAAASVGTLEGALEISKLTPAERLAHAKKLLNQKLLAIVPSTSKAAAATTSSSQLSSMFKLKNSLPVATLQKNFYATIKVEKEEPMVYKKLPVLPAKSPQEIARNLDFSSSGKKTQKLDINAPQFVHNFHLSQNQALRTCVARAEQQEQQMVHREMLAKQLLDEKIKIETNECEQQHQPDPRTQININRSQPQLQSEEQQTQKQQLEQSKQRLEYLAQVRALNRVKCEAYERRTQLSMEQEQPKYEHLPQTLNQEHEAARQILQQHLRVQAEKLSKQSTIQKQEELQRKYEKNQRQIQQQQQKKILQQQLQLKQKQKLQLELQQTQKQELLKNLPSLQPQLLDDQRQIKPHQQPQKSTSQLQLQPLPQLQTQKASKEESKLQIQLQPQLQLQPQRQSLPKSQPKLQEQQQSYQQEQLFSPSQSKQQEQPQPHPQTKQQPQKLLQPQKLPQPQPEFQSHPQLKLQRQQAQSEPQLHSQLQAQKQPLPQLQMQLKQQIQLEPHPQFQETPQPNEQLRLQQLQPQTSEQPQTEVLQTPQKHQKQLLKKAEQPQKLLPKPTAQPQQQKKLEAPQKSKRKPKTKPQLQPQPQVTSQSELTSQSQLQTKPIPQEQQHPQSSTPLQPQLEPPQQLPRQPPPPPPQKPSQDHHQSSHKELPQTQKPQLISNVFRNTLTYEEVFEKANSIIPKASIRSTPQTPPSITRTYSKQETPSFPQVSPLKKAFPTTTLPQEAPLPQISTFKKPFPLQKPPPGIPKNITITIADDLTYTIKPHPLNLIVLEDKVLTQAEKLDLTLFGLGKSKLEPDGDSPTTATDATFVNAEAQSAELPAIGATISTDPQQSSVVVNATQPKKFIIAPDKLKLSKDKIAALAKQIKSQALQQTRSQQIVGQATQLPRVQTKMSRSGSVIQLEPSATAEENSADGKNIRAEVTSSNSQQQQPKEEENFVKIDSIIEMQPLATTTQSSCTSDTVMVEKLLDSEQKQENVKKMGKIIRLEPRTPIRNISNKPILQDVNVVRNTAAEGTLLQKSNMSLANSVYIASPQTHPILPKTTVERKQTMGQPKIIKIVSSQSSKLIIPKPAMKPNIVAIENEEIFTPNDFDASTSTATSTFVGRKSSSGVRIMNDAVASTLDAVDFIAALAASTDYTESSPFELSAEELNLKATLGMSFSPLKKQSSTAPCTKYVTKSHVDSSTSTDATELLTQMYNNDDLEKNITHKTMGNFEDSEYQQHLIIGRLKNQVEHQVKKAETAVSKEEDLDIYTYGYLSVQSKTLPVYDYNQSEPHYSEKEEKQIAGYDIENTRYAIQSDSIDRETVVVSNKREESSKHLQVQKFLPDNNAAAVNLKKNYGNKTKSELEIEKAEQDHSSNYEFNKVLELSKEQKQSLVLNAKDVETVPREEQSKAQKHAPRIKKGKINLVPRKKTVAAKDEVFEISIKSENPKNEVSRVDGAPTKKPTSLQKKAQTVETSIKNVEIVNREPQEPQALRTSSKQANDLIPRTDASTTEQEPSYLYYESQSGRTSSTDSAEESFGQKKPPVDVTKVTQDMTEKWTNKEEICELEISIIKPLQQPLVKDSILFDAKISTERNIDSSLETSSLQPFANDTFTAHTKVNTEVKNESILQPHKLIEKESSDKMPSSQSDCAERNSESDELGLTPHTALEILQGTSQQLKSPSISMQEIKSILPNLFDDKEQKAKETEAAQILVSLIQPPKETNKEQPLIVAENPFKKKSLEVEKSAEKVVGIQNLLKQIEDNQLQQDIRVEKQSSGQENETANKPTIPENSGQEVVLTKMTVAKQFKEDQASVDKKVLNAQSEIGLRANEGENKMLCNSEEELAAQETLSEVSQLAELELKKTQLPKSEIEKTETTAKAFEVNQTKSPSQANKDKEKQKVEATSFEVEKTHDEKSVSKKSKDNLEKINYETETTQWKSSDNSTTLEIENIQPVKNQTRRSKSRTAEREIVDAKATKTTKTEEVSSSEPTEIIAEIIVTKPEEKRQTRQSTSKMVKIESAFIDKDLSVDAEKKENSETESTGVINDLTKNADCVKADDAVDLKNMQILNTKGDARQTRHSELKTVENELMSSAECEKIEVAFETCGAGKTSGANIDNKTATSSIKVEKPQTRHSILKRTEAEVISKRASDNDKETSGIDRAKEVSSVKLMTKTETLATKDDERQTRSSTTKIAERELISSAEDTQAVHAHSIGNVKDTSNVNITNRTDSNTPKAEKRQTRRSETKTLGEDLLSSASKKVDASSETHKDKETSSEEMKHKKETPASKDEGKQTCTSESVAIIGDVITTTEIYKTEAIAVADIAEKPTGLNIKNKTELTTAGKKRQTRRSKSKTAEREVISTDEGNATEVAPVAYEPKTVKVFEDEKAQKQTSKAITVEGNLLSYHESEAVPDVGCEEVVESTEKLTEKSEKGLKRIAKAKSFTASLAQTLEEGETVAKKQRTCSLVSFETSFVSQNKDENHKLQNKEPETINPSSSGESNKEHRQLSVAGENIELEESLKPPLRTYIKPRLESKQSTADTQSDIDITDIDYSTREDSNDNDETAQEESLQESKLNKISRKRLRKTLDDIKRGRVAEINTDDTDSDDDYNGAVNEFLGFDEFLPNAHNTDEATIKPIATKGSPEKVAQQNKQDEDIIVPSSVEKLRTKQLKDWLTTGKAGQPPLAKVVGKKVATVTSIKQATKTMPLKKRWELVQQRPHVETDITDDTSPAHDDDDDKEEVVEETVGKRKLDIDDEKEGNSKDETAKKLKLAEQEQSGKEHVFVKPQLIVTSAMNVSRSGLELAQPTTAAVQDIEALQADELMPDVVKPLAEPHRNEIANTETSSTLPKKRGRKPKETNSSTVATKQLGLSTEAESESKFEHVGQETSSEIPDTTLATTSLPKKRRRKPACKADDVIGTSKLLNTQHSSAELVDAVKTEHNEPQVVAESSQTEAVESQPSTPLPKKRGRKPKVLHTPQESKELNFKVLDETPGTSAQEAKANTLLPTKRGRKPKKFFEDIVTITKTSTPTKSRTNSVGDSESSINDSMATVTASTVSTAAGPRKRGRKSKILSAASNLNETTASEHNTVIAEASDATFESQSTQELLGQKRRRQSKDATVQETPTVMNKPNEPKSIIEIFTSSISTNPNKSETHNETRGDSLNNALNWLDEKLSDILSSAAKAKDGEHGTPTSVEMQSKVPTVKKRGRKPNHSKIVDQNITSTDFNGTTVELNTAPIDLTKFNKDSIFPRILLIRNREQLDNDEPLTSNTGQPKPGDVKCALCLDNVKTSKWSHHLSEHYGVGWKLGNAPMDISSKTSVVNIIISYIKDTQVKGLNCRLCQRFYRSGLGMITHLESCGVSAEEQKKNRIKCEYCQNTYTPSSYKQHERTCPVRIALEKQEATNREAQVVAATTAEVLNNVGRVKRRSQLKAEHKLKAIGEELLAAPTEGVEFEPEKHIRFEPVLCAADYEEQFFKDLKNFGNGYCPRNICRFACLNFMELEEHLTTCKLMPKPGYHCMLCKTKEVFATQELAVKHVTKEHKPCAESNDLNDSDSSDCKIEESESSSEDCLSGVDSNKEDEDEEGGDSDAAKTNDSANDYGRERKRIIKRRTKPNQPIVRPILYSDKKQLYRARVVVSRKGIYDKWKQFTRNNYSDSILFDYGAANFSTYAENTDDFEKLLPRQYDSMKFTFSTKNKINTIFGNPKLIDDWRQLKRFETLIEKYDHFTFIGAPVKVLAWAPLPNGSGHTQYLAISYRKDMDKYTRAFNPKIAPALILIYKINMKATEHESKIQLYYAMRIPNGPVHCFDFLPSGGYAPTANRLGLLAVGTACSDVQVYALPLTIMDENVKQDTESRLTVLDLMPVFVLSLDLSTMQRTDAEGKEQCTCLKWSEFRHHNLIFCGFSNGFVGIWDVSDSENENLNSFMVNAVRHFVPLNYFFCGERGVRDLALHYDTMGPRWLAICAFGRKAVIYDLRELTNPCIVREDFAKNVICALEWPVIGESVALSMSDAIVNNGTCLVLRSPLSISFTTSKIDNMISAVNQAKYNPCQSVYYSVTDNGDILFHSVRELHCGLRKKMQLSAKAVTTLDVKCLSGEKVPVHGDNTTSSSQVTESKNKEMYGLVFAPILTFTQQVDKDFRSLTRLPPFNMRRFTRINCLSCNVNAKGKQLVAFGFENGFLRIIDFDESKYLS